jgi:seryl-tRNA synthetase
MLDITFIRENLDLVKAGAKKKHIKVDLDALTIADDKRRVLLQEIEKMRAEQNVVSDKIVQISDSDEKKRVIDEMRTLKEKMQAKEKQLEEIMHEWQLLMVQVPNVPDLIGA